MFPGVIFHSLNSNSLESDNGAFQSVMLHNPIEPITYVVRSRLGAAIKKHGPVWEGAKMAERGFPW